MQTWAVQDAKARFSELLDACVSGKPQLVTKRGTEAAVLVPVETWRRLQNDAKPSLKTLLLQEDGRGDDLIIPPRGQAKRRKMTEIL